MWRELAARLTRRPRADAAGGMLVPSRARPGRPKIDVARVYTRAIVERAEAGETNLITEVCFAKNTAVENGAWVVNEADIRSRSKNTCFEGARMQGRVLQTMVAGRTVFSS